MPGCSHWTDEQAKQRQEQTKRRQERLWEIYKNEETRRLNSLFQSDEDVVEKKRPALDASGTFGLHLMPGKKSDKERANEFIVRQKIKRIEDNETLDLVTKNVSRQETVSIKALLLQAMAEQNAKFHREAAATKRAKEYREKELMKNKIDSVNRNSLSTTFMRFCIDTMYKIRLQQGRITEIPPNFAKFPWMLPKLERFAEKNDNAKNRLFRTQRVGAPPEPLYKYWKREFNASTFFKDDGVLEGCNRPFDISGINKACLDLAKRYMGVDEKKENKKGAAKKSKKKPEEDQD